MKWIRCVDRLPEDIPKDEDFGINYEIMYLDENNKKRIGETEWLWDRTWNWRYPVIAWRELNTVTPFPSK